MNARLLALALMGLLLMTGFAGVARAQEEADDTETPEEVDPTQADNIDEAEPLSAHSDIETTFLFPDFPDKKLRLGSEVTMLLHLANAGSSEFNITRIGAHLHSPFDFSYFIQNFTQSNIEGATLGDSEELSLDYRFKPEQSLEPLEFWFSAWVMYNSSGEQFISHIYNGTIELVEDKTPADVKKFFTYFLGISGVGLIIYIALRVSTGKSAPVERGTRESSSVKVYTPSSKSKPVRSRSSRSKKKKN